MSKLCKECNNVTLRGKYKKFGLCATCFKNKLAVGQAKTRALKESLKMDSPSQFQAKINELADYDELYKTIWANADGLSRNDIYFLRNQSLEALDKGEINRFEAIVEGTIRFSQYDYDEDEPFVLAVFNYGTLNNIAEMVQVTQNIQIKQDCTPALITRYGLNEDLYKAFDIIRDPATREMGIYQILPTRFVLSAGKIEDDVEVVISGEDIAVNLYNQFDNLLATEKEVLDKVAVLFGEEAALRFRERIK